MSDAAVAAPAGAKGKKGGGKKKLLMIAGGAVLLLGGGVAAGIYASGAGLAGHGESGPKGDPDQPQLVPRDGEHGGEGAGSGEHGGSDEGSKFDSSKYKATYFSIENNFTSNLRDSDGFAQIGIGVSTYYDNRVIDNMKEHEVAIRSAILMTLADQDAFVITTPEGKKALQKSLKDAINGVLKSKTGFGGIDDVYFTSFIIQ